MKPRGTFFAAAAALLLAAAVLLPGAVGGWFFRQPSGKDFDGLREAMVNDQIAARGVRHEGVLQAMRSIPRMRAVEELDEKVRKYAPPPPFASRMGGLAQGCGGVLLTLTAIVMFLAAMWFGYYLW
ncbi:MAG TPA: hypothetical protein PLT21_05410, partial [Syntrophales bacterium]|nr:hypothetical protein [Syntrophales bacterium]